VILIGAAVAFSKRGSIVTASGSPAPKPAPQL
jgi:hypothetical protein